ncbi:MAG TPA: hypothetical protein VMM18_00210 [Gemmatimonadaceae bacterium]|nr:hypothetical protein [Gemmatimonadaceae bacterium]
MRRLFLLVVVAAAVLAGWYLRDLWTREPEPAAADAEGVVWEPLTMEGAERARAAVQQLARSSGPVFQNIRPGDLASYVYVELARQLPPSAEDVRAAVIGERLYLKAWVRLSEMGAAEVLGPFAGMVSERDTVSFGGTFDIVRPGMAQFRVRDLRVRELSIPPRYVPRLLARVRRGAVPEGIAEDGLPLEVPAHIGDVRIAGGRITLYKNVP